MDGIYWRSCRGALRGARVRCVRTAALFWVLFWCQKSTAAQLFGCAPYGALSSFEDGTCEDKRYPSAVSMISCVAKETLTVLASLKKGTASTAYAAVIPGRMSYAS